MRAASLVFVAVLFGTSCGGGSGPSSTPTAPSPTLTSLIVRVQGGGSSIFTAIGETRQLEAVASYSDGSSRIVTGEATWRSGQASVATVSATGLASAVGSGQVTITATLSGRSGEWSAEVRLTVDISGTWTGAYFHLGGVGLSDGQMTWTLTQTGDSFSGTFLIRGDTFFGPVDGTMRGTFGTGSQARTFTFTVDVPGGGIPDWGSCTLTLTGTSNPLPSAITTLSGIYTGTFCGIAVTNGNFQLTRQ